LKGCLDAWAAVAWAKDDPGAREVDRCIRDGATMSWINIGEVDYILRREQGDDYADRFSADLERIVVAETPTPERVRVAARLKARYRMSYADCFAVATALAVGLPLLTGDPEIVNAGVPGLRVVDLR
jgi:predicted nucleic acid-binding protein